MDHGIEVTLAEISTVNALLGAYKAGERVFTIPQGPGHFPKPGANFREQPLSATG
jgi:hypothetical protein